LSTRVVAGVFLIAMPIAFNVSLALLGARFDYPDILRGPSDEVLERFRPSDEVLERFRQGGTPLLVIWWAFALTAALFVPLVVLLSAAIAPNLARDNDHRWCSRGAGSVPRLDSLAVLGSVLGARGRASRSGFGATRVC
jgi:hypothetical protein